MRESAINKLKNWKGKTETSVNKEYDKSEKSTSKTKDNLKRINLCILIFPWYNGSVHLNYATIVPVDLSTSIA